MVTFNAKKLVDDTFGSSIENIIWLVNNLGLCIVHQIQPNIRRLKKYSHGFVSVIFPIILSLIDRSRLESFFEGSPAR